MSNMTYDELESHILKSIDSKTPKFEQKANPEFAESRIIPNKTLVGLGIGGGISGLATGVLNKYSPVNLDQFGVAGVPAMAVGTLLKLTVAKSGMAEDIANGMIVAGISEAVSGLTGNLPSLAQKREKPVETKNTQIPNRGSGIVW